MKDFANLVKRTKQLKMEVALDIAFQCAPDHPWVKEHPEFFKKRPDGSIHVCGESAQEISGSIPWISSPPNWRGLWDALRDVFTFWMDAGGAHLPCRQSAYQGVPIWQWVIPELKAKDPNVLLLAEAFTRPRVMERLAKVGFSQSYHLLHLARQPKKSSPSTCLNSPTTRYANTFGLNFWPNTPGQSCPGICRLAVCRPFAAAVVLATTLSANYGIYGPAFELGDNHAGQTGNAKNT